MGDFDVRIKILAIKIAQNVERGSYYESGYDEIGGVDRGPWMGDSGQAPAKDAIPQDTPPDYRRNRKRYPGYMQGDPLVRRDGPGVPDNAAHDVGGEIEVAEGDKSVVMLD